MKDHRRFHADHEHAESAFGNDIFGKLAESFARFFGTPLYMVLQTVFTIIWLVGNWYLWFHFDKFPFFFLNFIYTIQAGYAAPLILLAQTRQANRDRLNSEADAKHREDIAKSHNEQMETIKQIVESIQSQMAKGK